MLRNEKKILFDTTIKVSLFSMCWLQAVTYVAVTYVAVTYVAVTYVAVRYVAVTYVAEPISLILIHHWYCLSDPENLLYSDHVSVTFPVSHIG